MKKKIALLLAFCLTFLSAIAFSGCSRPQGSPYQVYAAAAQKTSANGSIDANLDMTAKIEMAGMSMEMGVSGNTKATTADGKPQAMLADMQLSVLGQKVDMDMYYADGILYTSSAGQKAKTSVSAEEVLEQLGSYKPIEFEESALKESSLKVENGNQIISVVLDGKALNDILAKQIGGMLSDSGASEGIDPSSMSFSDVTMTAEVNKDGYLTKTDMKFDMTAKIADAGDMTYTMELVLTMNNPGQAVTITPPADLDSYQETSGDNAA